MTFKMHYLTSEHKKYIREKTESMIFFLNKNLFLCTWKLSATILLKFKKGEFEIGWWLEGLQMIRGMNLILYEKKNKMME